MESARKGHADIGRFYNDLVPFTWKVISDSIPRTKIPISGAEFRTTDSGRPTYT
jgi:hypothetical protein